MFEESIDIAIGIVNWVDADQSTGRIVHVPNSKVLREPLANYHIGFEYIWNEIQVRITFESAWKKAKRLLQEIASANVEHLSTGAQAQIRQAAKKYFVFFTKLIPIVYTTVLTFHFPQTSLRRGRSFSRRVPMPPWRIRFSKRKAAIFRMLPAG